MTAIVPLLRFNISGYDLKDIIHLPTPFTSLKLNRIDKHNFNDFKTFCTSISKRFRCCIHMDSLNVYDLILKENSLYMDCSTIAPPYVTMYLDRFLVRWIMINHVSS